jgi:uncharacterized repeat protein (TIGR01451 family)
VKDLITGDIILASTSDAGVKGNSASVVPSISADGTKVAFYSFANNLEPAADGDFIPDVYVKDLITGDIRVASTSDAGVKGNRDSLVPSISADGSKVAFYSFANNLEPAADGDFLPDIYVKDVSGGDITVASTSDAGVKGNNDSILPSINADGSRVAFDSRATNLEPNADTDTINDIYVKDLATGEVKLASTSDAGIKGDNSSVEPAISADGTRVAFRSFAANLDPADTDSVSDIYAKDLTTGDTILASASDLGSKGNAGSFRPAISGDGATVAFDSNATNLDPTDEDSLLDVYVKELGTGDIALVSASDVGAKGDDHSSGPALSAEGLKVAFHSRAMLEPGQDSDTLTDIYVKEVARADLSLTKTDSNDPAPTGRNLTYTLIVTNEGPHVARGVVVADTLPPSVSYVSATPSQGSCTQAGGTVRCTLGSIGVGATASIDIVVRPTSVGIITNTATISAPASDPVPANNTDTENTRVCRRMSKPTSIPCR